MTRDQKQALTGLLALVAFKAILYISIHQTAKAARVAIAKYESKIA